MDTSRVPLIGTAPALVLGVLLAASAVRAADGAGYPGAPPHRLSRTWTASLQAGYTNTYQMTLGGLFGEGPYFQNRATAGVNNLFRSGDSLSVFGTSSTDVPNGVPDWQAGILYRTVVLNKPRHTLALGGGVQRWLLPNVKTGAQDWLAAGSLAYNTSVKKVPLTVTQDSWSLLRSTLPTGSVLYTQVYSQHTLLHGEHFRLLARQGPAHTYSWGFYGANGHRVLRYSATLVAMWKNTTLEAGCRQQYGLEDGIRNNRFWSVLVTRQFSGRVGKLRSEAHSVNSAVVSDKTK